MQRGTIPLLILAGLFTGGILDAPQPASVSELRPELTAERAQTALIELIRSSDAGDLKDFPLDQFAGENVANNGKQFSSWGPFDLLLEQREYTYTRAFGRPPRVCRWFHRGKFEFKQGKWIALKPQVESRALGVE